MAGNAEASLILTNIARAAFGIGICTTIVNSSLYTVGGGQRAVLFDRFRGVLKDTVGEGKHFLVPWLQKPYIFDIRMRPHTFSSISGTKDLQMVNLTLCVLFRPEVNSLPDIFKTLGPEYDDKVLPSIGNEVLKAVVAQFNADQLLIERPHVSALVRESLIRRAKEFNIVLDDVEITHLSYGVEFPKAVEQKQVGQQEAERSKFVVATAAAEMGLIKLRKNETVRDNVFHMSRNGNVLHLPNNNLAFPLNCSLRRIHMEINNESVSRGALIVVEGLDRCGKTSQCGRLLSYLEELEHSVESWRFPDRDTGVGQMISSYLSNKSHLDDRAIHLLFSANRWEKRSLMESKLRSGTTLIIDRYSFSGVAFSSAKGLDVEWCKAPETGLLAPDLVVYLDISPEEAAKRGGYGGERYEQLEFQKRVAQSYKALSDATWKIIDATLPIEDVEKQLKQNVMECMVTCRKGKPFSELWQN